MIISQQEKKLLYSAYRNGLPTSSAIEHRLKSTLQHSVNTPGALVRGQIAFKSLINLQVAHERALAVAVAIEYFQTASLLLDDLPCMDDATYRRGELCAHKMHGDASQSLPRLR